MIIYLIGRHKFGSNIDYLNWFFHLNSKGYTVYYLCTGLVQGYNSHENIIFYLGKWNKFGIIFFSKWCSSIIKGNKLPCIVFVKAFQGMSLIKLFLNNKLNAKLVSDVRSQSVNVKNRQWLNFLMFIESKVFDYRTAINHQVGIKIFKNKDFSIIKLGANSKFLDLVKDHNTSTSIKFIYIGTFYQRNILDLVYAFLESNTSYNKKLIVIGADDEIVGAELQKLSKLHPKLISYLGYIPNDEIGFYLKKASIGISWVPITDWFDWQPPTKIIEYLMSGLPVLATNTKASKELIDSEVGWLIDDNYHSAKSFFESFNPYDLPSNEICRLKVLDRTWEKIVDNDLIPFISSVE